MLAAATANPSILDLFEVGKGKANRATEVVFVERCLALVKPGGRVGIVLPDGNLNNPSLAWLRRWCEGKARIFAVISLPKETFSSADAAVKASIVFLKRFTEDDQTTWDAAWDAAHAVHEAIFDRERDDLCATYGPRIVSGDDKEAARCLADLTAIGVERVVPAWFSASPPPYPKRVGATKLKRPGWIGEATSHAQVSSLKKDYAKAFTEEVAKHAEFLTGQLKTALRAVDERHDAALWAHVRKCPSGNTLNSGIGLWFGQL